MSWVARALFVLVTLSVGVSFSHEKLSPRSAAAAPSATGYFFNDAPANDIIWDPGTQRIYATLPNTVPTIGNSITPIDPVARTIGTSVFMGSNPGKLARSDNGQYLYAALNGSAAV